MTANYLSRRGHDLSVLNFVGPTDGTRYLLPRWGIDDGVPVVPLQTLPADGGRKLHESFHPIIKDRIPNLSFSFTANQLSALRQLNSTLDEQDWIIFTHPLQAEIYRRSIGSDIRRVRTLMQIHGDYKTRHPELIPLLMGARSVVDEIQVVSSGMTHDYINSFGAQRVHWIPNIHESTTVVRQPHEGINVVVVGSFQEMKNQIDAVRMMTKINDSSVRLTLWGNDQTKYGEHVRNLVSELGLSYKVRLAGVGTEAEVYGSADIVVVPSRSEGFGYALVEAASNGLPVVAYDYDYGPRDVIRQAKSGFIVDQGDVDSLAARVALLAGSDDLRVQLGRRARSVYEQEFSPESIVDRYEEVLGAPTNPKPSVSERFPIEGSDPVALPSIRSRNIVLCGKTIGHIVSFESEQRLKRFQLASQRRKKSARALRFFGRYYVPIYRGDPDRSFRTARQRVLSYETRDPRLGRFYLGNTSKQGGFETSLYLRRTTTPPGSVFEFRAGELAIPRDPRFPPTAGTDSWGVRLNEPGAVSLKYTGGTTNPRVTLAGEFDGLNLSSAAHQTVFNAPFSYREMFERLCEAERQFYLFEHEIAEGIHPWELYRAAFVAEVCEALGFWGPQFNRSSVPPLDNYSGRKSLNNVGGYSRILFEFPRKRGDHDWRTQGIADSDTLVIEYPQVFGYSSAVYNLDNHVPIQAYNQWKGSKPRLPNLRVDSRPFEQAISAAFEFPVSIGKSLNARVRKFLEEREFFTRVFEDVQPEEVLIPSSYWSAGICEAAKRNGAVASDIQYALTSRFHPSYWFGQPLEHGATRFYAWSDFWASRTNAYDEHVIRPRQMQNSIDARKVPDYDFCVVSQPRVHRRILRFVGDLAHANPEARICVCPHPDERVGFESKLRHFSNSDRLIVAPNGTEEAMRHSRIVFGAYSTSMYEAAAMGKPTYVIPAPGAEIALDDIDSGLFRMVDSLADIKEFRVIESAFSLFGK